MDQVVASSCLVQGLSTSVRSGSREGLAVCGASACGTRDNRVRWVLSGVPGCVECGIGGGRSGQHATDDSAVEEQKSSALASSR